MGRDFIRMVVGVFGIACAVVLGVLFAWKLFVNVYALVKFLFPFTK